VEENGVHTEKHGSATSHCILIYCKISWEGKIIK